MTDGTITDLYPERRHNVSEEDMLSEDKQDAQGLLKAIMEQQPEAVQVTYMVNGHVYSTVSNQPYHTLAILYGYSQLNFHSKLGESIRTSPINHTTPEGE